eukprot:m.32244 g.32244  ORF g.32244 m.32244 type:complete len:964 (+) comp8391_c0_seq2:184-3075(+)
MRFSWCRPVSLFLVLFFLAHLTSIQCFLQSHRGRLSERIGDHDLVSLDLSHIKSQRRLVRRSGGAEMLKINFQAFDQEFNLKLAHSDKQFADNFRVEFVRESGRVDNIFVDKSIWFRGRLHGPGTADSDVRAHVVENGVFATINLNGEIFRLEPMNNKTHTHIRRRDMEIYNHVIYSHSHTETDPRQKAVCGIHDHDNHDSATSKYAKPPKDQVEDFMRDANDGRQRRVIDWDTQHTCVMSLVSDRYYFESEGESSAVTTANKMIAVLEDANAIYSTTTFTGLQDGYRVQLAVGKITIFETSGSSGSIVNPFKTSSTTDASRFLDEFSGESGSPPLGHDEFCLAHAFTRQDFDEGTLGLAWLGTICQNDKNTGISTIVNFGSTVPYTQFMLVFAHEVGHNFGMSHDNSCAAYCAENPSECSGSTLSDVSGGKYIMWPTSVDGESANNKLFSECSRFSAGATLANGGAACFRDTGGAICGNGIVQGDEECDCGSPIADVNGTFTADEYNFCVSQSRNPNNYDKCCLPNCKLNVSAKCSPEKGACCDDNCQLTGVETSDLIFGTLTPIDESAAEAAGHKCASSTDCTLTGYCVKDDSFQGDCPPEALKNSENKSLFDQPDGTLCNKERNTCSSGECVGSLCAAYQKPNSSAPKLCELADSPCDIACIFEDGGSCISTRDTDELAALGLTGDDYPNGTFKAPGKSCNDFAGYCDEQGSCRAPSNDSPLDILKNYDIDWVWENWYVVFIIETIIILLAFLLRCTRNSEVKKTKKFVRGRLKREDSEVRRRAGLVKTRRQSRADTRQNKGETWQQLAVLKAQAAGQRRLSQIEVEDRQKGLAYFRLKTLFPKAKWPVIRKMVALSPHEEAAVARMLALGYSMWLVPDYKMLNFAAKRFRKRAQQAALAKDTPAKSNNRNARAVSGPPPKRGASKQPPKSPRSARPANGPAPANGADRARQRRVKEQRL